MPDLQQQLQQLVSNDLPSLTSYYIEVSSEKGPGVLVVNYYPDSDLVDTEARFLKKSQIPNFLQEFGLDELQTHFDSHDPQTQMIMAVISEDTMGVLTIDVTRPEGKAIPTRRQRPKPKGFS